MGTPLTIGVTTHVFFDDTRLKRSVNKANRLNMREVGKRVRKRAKVSMKLAPADRAAPKGQPPHAHRRSKENPSGGGLKKSILYAYDTARKSVVVGPSVRYGRKIATVGTRHEFGGMISEPNPRHKIRKEGDGGEIRYAKSRRGMSGKKHEKGTTKLATNTLQGKVFVTYGLLRSREQVDRANRIRQELYGPVRIQGRYPKRQFMRPAMRKTRPEIRSIWQNSITA